MTELFNKELGYSSLNTARGALSALGITLDRYPAGSHPTVIRFMKGVYNVRPPKPKHTEIWDVDCVLCLLRKLSPVKHLTLKDLTLKLTMLLCLTNATRVHTVHVLSYKSLKKFKHGYMISTNSLLKQSRPGFDFSSFLLKSYPPDRRLCIVTVLREYVKRTKDIRDKKDDTLLISYVKPYKPVTRDTIRRWITTIMARAGIDTSKFGAHSVRAACTSKAMTKAVPVSLIMKTAGWTSESTFHRFYNKTITKDKSFADAVLQESG